MNSKNGKGASNKTIRQVFDRSDKNKKMKVFLNFLKTEIEKAHQVLKKSGVSKNLTLEISQDSNNFYKVQIEDKYLLFKLNSENDKYEVQLSDNCLTELSLKDHYDEEELLSLIEAIFTTEISKDEANKIKYFDQKVDSDRPHFTVTMTVYPA